MLPDGEIKSELIHKHQFVIVSPFAYVLKLTVKWDFTFK